MFLALIGYMMGKRELMKCKYPKGYLLTTYVTPNKISFAYLKNIINFCHGNLISKEWNEKNVRFYCVVNFISEKGQDKIIEYADNYLALQSSLFFNEEVNILEKDATMFPWKYKN